MLEQKIEAYSLFEFCQKIQEALKDGFTFDFEKNSGVPTAFGSLHEVVLFKVLETEKRKYTKKSESSESE